MILPHKRLGQHFLTDSAVLGRILEAANLKKSDVVLEIGTGTGTLTGEIANKAKKVITVEVDNKLLEVAKDNLKKHKNIEYINQSFLKYKIPKTVNKVVSNVPYYLTTPIIIKLLEETKLDLIVITIQREVAERIIASPPGKVYGSFSVFVQAQTEAKIHSFIPKSAFRPQPKVSSAILVLKPYKKLPYQINFDLVRCAFGKRRKKLKNALKGFKFKIDFEKAEIDPNRRAETLSLEEWEKLTSPSL